MQQKAQPRGPLVWRDMDQQALDRAYDQGVYAPNRDQVLGRIAAASERARKALGAPQRLAFGRASRSASISTEPQPLPIPLPRAEVRRIAARQ
jgi:hypothetical protein